MSKTRLDHRLIQLGLAPSRQKALDYIKSGQVKIDSQVAIRASQRVTLENEVSVINPDRWVSRGSHKLKHALSFFKINLINKTCLDVGASTGGFTQVCLESKARRVYAVDVGTNQLHPILKKDERVVPIEQTHIKDLQLTDKVDFLCADVSFISLTQTIPHFVKHLNNAETVLLIKPQYEVGKENLPADGIVIDPVLHQNSIEKVVSCAKDFGLSLQGLTPSPIRGKAGNTEFLAHFEFKNETL